jgi:hypothetical protein
VGGFCLDERLRVWLKAEEGISKSGAIKVIAMRFKVFVSSSALSFFRAVVGIVPETNAAVRMTRKDHDLVV